jgi:hypothetical protein
LPVSDFNRVTSDLQGQGYAIISEVDHPIARMAFFDTYQTLGVATEIIGITPEGWIAIEQMQKAGEDSRWSRRLCDTFAVCQRLTQTARRA